jgi:hypothetical protein
MTVQPKFSDAAVEAAMEAYAAEFKRWDCRPSHVDDWVNAVRDDDGMGASWFPVESPNDANAMRDVAAMRAALEAAEAAR